mmetsp:Transcript_11441/g.17197  ORF Transcript_11441/g.17197 Transcript_11441/m.17197 type:complete len:315 (+) Transcript_11441:2-946(+)
MRRSEIELENALGRADDDSVDWIFPPPSHLSHQASLEEARAAASAEGRWILVNLQSHAEFGSQMLNRDTFTNETVESILRTSFLLWQRGHTSRQGREYMRMHSLSEDDLPHLGIIDPRTGAKLKTFTGFVTPEDLIIRLMEFSESHTLSVPQLPQVIEKAAAGTESVVSESESERFRSESNLNVYSNRNSFDSQKVDDEPNGKMAADELPVDSSSASSAVVYDLPSDEPPESARDAVKVSIKLLNGKSFPRRYYRNASVEELFRVAASVEPAVAQKQESFDLVTRFPATSLKESLHKTIGECNLAGSQIFFRWL